MSLSVDSSGLQNAQIDEKHPKTFRTFVKEGILFHEYHKSLTVDIIIQAEAEAFELIKRNNLEHVLYIVDITDIDETGYNVGIKDFGKLIFNTKLFMHTSHIWVCGAKGKILKLSQMMNKFFFRGKVRMVDTVDEALKEARNIKAEASILEK